MNIDTNIFNHFKSIYKTITKEEIIQYKEYLKEKESLISKKHIKLESRKVFILKRFYSYFSIKNINERKYNKYKEFVSSVNESDNNIKTIADI
jgi:hypothetical protein